MKTQASIESLREQGYKIRVTHYRYNQYGDLISRRKIDEENAGPRLDDSKPRHIISPNGGKVEVELEAADGTKVSATAECSRLDNFNRKIGTTMAFGRALKQLKPPSKKATA